MQLFDHKAGKYAGIDDARIYYEEIGNHDDPVL